MAPTTTTATTGAASSSNKSRNESITENTLHSSTTTTTTISTEPKSAVPLDVPALVAPMKATHASGENQSLAWRRQNLQLLKRMLMENKDAIEQAAHQDIGKVSTEIWVAECMAILAEIDVLLSGLRKWMRPVRKAAATHAFPSFCQTRRVPLRGPAVLVIGPSNYPVLLSLAPAAGAIAGGNPVVMKPSEQCPQTAALLERMVNETFDPSVFRVVQGGVVETTALLQQEWGKVFFTGSGRVGRIVAEAAAKTLTPCVLELGGKSPVYVDKDLYNVKLVAERLVWGKFWNAGQTCVGIDYVLLHKDIADKVLEHLPKALTRQFGTDPKQGEMSKMIQPVHAHRQVELLQEVEACPDTKILVGGSVHCKPESKYIAPTIVLEPPTNSRMMKEEIFGPILPILIVDSKEDAQRFINNLTGTPLALYIFTSNNACYNDMFNACPSATVCRNDSCAQFNCPELPAGGLGSSGYGNNHGRASFETFTHERSEMHRPLLTDLGYLKYHPFAGIKTRALEVLLGILPSVPVLYTRRWIGLGVFLVMWVYFPFSSIKEPIANGLADALQWVADGIRSS